MARYTLLEAVRTRFPIMVLVAIALLLLISFFVEALAVTESARFQASVYAAGMRLAGVFIAALYVLVSIAREFNDKGFDIVLALTRGGPARSTEVLNMVVFQEFGSGRFSYATAVSLVLFVVILLVAFPLIFVLRRREVTL